MKVETPQILWHNTQNGSQKENGKNSPILSCSLLDTNATRDDISAIGQYPRTAVLATAGNTEINLWRVIFSSRVTRVARDADKDNTMDRPQILVKSCSPRGGISVENGNRQNSCAENTESDKTRIHHILTLERGTNGRTINAVKFSPDGRHLAATGDGGNVVVWSLPSHIIASTVRKYNGVHPSTVAFWSNQLAKETDLHMKILFNQSDDVMDVAWGPDSKRFIVCTLDHTLSVYEQTNRHIYLKASTEVKPDWRHVHRSTKDHTHYIQGVAYDPKGVYLASQGSDRTVKVFTRKNFKDSVVKEAMSKTMINAANDNREHIVNDGKESRLENKSQKEILQSQVLPYLLSCSKFELQPKGKTIKFLNTRVKLSEIAKASQCKPDSATNEIVTVEGHGKESPNVAPKRHHLFADELTVRSYFRRLAFTPDGAFLVTPAALWHGNTRFHTSDSLGPISNSTICGDQTAEASYATYLFARHHYDQPHKVLTGLEKPSVVVRPNPLLFKLPNHSSDGHTAKSGPLAYRSVFAVLTIDSVLVYDTHHRHPLSIARGLHYSGLTDAAWSADGTALFVTSSDGYVSVLSFGDNELGVEYEQPSVSSTSNEQVFTPLNVNAADSRCTYLGTEGTTSGLSPTTDVGAKPKETTDDAIHILRPKKKKRIAPTLISNKETCNQDFTPDPCRAAPSETDGSKISSKGLQPSRKKRIQPTLISC